MKVNVKKILKPVLILGVIGAVGFFSVNAMMKNAAAAMQAPPPRSVILQKGDLSNVVSVTGTVYSQNSTNVYSNVAAPVQTIHVEVGDLVQEGDLLAELDSSDLEFSLRSTQATVYSGQASAQHSLEMAKKNLNTYENNLNDDTNTTLIQAETALKNAEINVDAALMTSGRLRKKMSELRDIGYTMDDEDYKLVKERHEDALVAVDQAYLALESAKKTYEAAKENNETGSVTEKERLRDQIKSAELANNFNAQYLSIEKTKEDIENCRIVAPVSGTITSVQAVEGGSGAGLLFVIQDGESLKIVTNIKEYDIGSVTLGNSVIIKSDALPGREYEGSLAKIAPTSNAAAGGTVRVAADSEYESEIAVTGNKEGLRIGMNTKLSIVTEKRTNIYSVPYEAVGQTETGGLVIYTMETDEAGVVTTREIIVTVGMENDLFSEVSAPELTDGLEVYRDATEGQAAYAKALEAAAAAAASQAAE